MLLACQLADVDNCDDCVESMESLHGIAESIITPGNMSQNFQQNLSTRKNLRM